MNKDEILINFYANQFKHISKCSLCKAEIKEGFKK